MKVAKMFERDMSRKIAANLVAIRDERLRARARNEVMREELQPRSSVENLSPDVRRALDV